MSSNAGYARAAGRLRATRTQIDYLRRGIPVRGFEQRIQADLRIFGRCAQTALERGNAQVLLNVDR